MIRILIIILCKVETTGNLFGKGRHSPGHDYPLLIMLYCGCVLSSTVSCNHSTSSPPM